MTQGQDYAEVVHTAYESGIRFFDTADVYVKGAAEIALGQALQPYSPSEHIVATKCFFPVSDEALNRGLSFKHIVESVRGSLGRLKRQTVDIQFCHRYDPEVPLREVAAAMKHLQDAGLCFYWATSEWPIEALQRVRDWADRLGGPLPVADQYELNLLNYAARSGRAEELNSIGIGAVAWGSLAGGLLTGKYDETVPDDSRFGVFKQLGGGLEPSRLDQARRFTACCRDRQLSPTAAAIRFLLEDSKLTSVLVGATHPDHVRSACEALEQDYDEDLHSVLFALAKG